MSVFANLQWKQCEECGWEDYRCNICEKCGFFMHYHWIGGSHKNNFTVYPYFEDDISIKEFNNHKNMFKSPIKTYKHFKKGLLSEFHKHING